MACPQAADGDGLQIWKVVANIMNKQSWTSDKGVVFQLNSWLGMVLSTIHHKKASMLQNITH
jgi:hypothetical protein